VLAAVTLVRREVDQAGLAPASIADEPPSVALRKRDDSKTGCSSILFGACSPRVGGTSKKPTPETIAVTETSRSADPHAAANVARARAIVRRLIEREAAGQWVSGNSITIVSSGSSGSAIRPVRSRSLWTKSTFRVQVGRALF
jgi:hypothetical protein